MANLYETIRTASARSPQDAAFYILFVKNIGDLQEDINETLRASHPETDDRERNQAVERASSLGNYCKSISTNPDVSGKISADALAQKFPGFSQETYTLAPRYIKIPEIKRERRLERKKDVKSWLKAPAYLAIGVALLRLLNVLANSHH